QFVLHSKALPGNPYDGHTLGDLNSTETLTGCAIERAYVDKGYRGHKTENPRPASSSPVRSVASWWDQTRTQAPLSHRARDRSPEDRRTPRPLPSQGGARDAANVILTAVGHNLRLVLTWLRLLLRLIPNALMRL